MSDKEVFNKWLTSKLKTLNTDESVFGSYILGILEGDESKDEKHEALEGILSAIIVRFLWNIIFLCSFKQFSKTFVFTCRKMTLKMW